MANAAVAYASAVAEVRPDDVTDSRPVGRRAGVGVDDVRAALVLARGGDGEVLDGDHGGELVEVLGVPDADPPAAVRRGAAARDDVAAGVDAEVLGARRRRAGRRRRRRPSP